MDRKSNPCFLAYIIFLCVCLVYRIICNVFPSLSFAYWNQIVLAVTISSSFFTISDALKTVYDVSSYTVEKMNRLIRRDDTLFEISKDLIEKVAQEVEWASNAFSKEEQDEMKQLVEKYRMLSEKESEEFSIEHLEKSAKKWTFVFTLLGFLAFLIILVFDSVYSICFRIQDILTLITFIVILATGYMKESVIEGINKCEAGYVEEFKAIAEEQKQVKKRYAQLQYLKRIKDQVGEEEQ